MKITGNIANINTDGYERLLTIEANNRVFWCSYLELSEYLAPEQPSECLKTGNQFISEVFLKYVTKSKLVEGEAFYGIIQNVFGSPHATVCGQVIEKLESDVCIISLNECDRIKVEFEYDFQFHVGDCICVEGELTVEDDTDESGNGQSEE